MDFSEFTVVSLIYHRCHIYKSKILLDTLNSSCYTANSISYALWNPVCLTRVYFLPCFFYLLQNRSIIDIFLSLNGSSLRVERHFERLDT